MAYVNTPYFNEGETEPSNYSELTQPDAADVSYSTINYDRRTGTVGLSAANLEPSSTVQRPNIHTRIIEHDGIEKSTDQLLVKCTCQKFNLKLILVIIGMIVIAAASSTITALLLKQNFDDLLTDIREEMVSKQDIGQESVWSEWSVWGECSAPCDVGIQRRVRTCDISDKGLRVCVGNDVDIIACNNNTCDSKCNNNTCEEHTWSEWSEWSPWGECSVTCNGGIHSRVRTCDGSGKGPHVCVGNTIEMSACNNNTCVENIWSQWSPWGECSVSCDGGIQSRVRTCDGSNKGPHACIGNTIEISACNNITCVENTWSEWSDWGECSATCKGGIQSRVRSCDGSGKGPHACVGNDVDIAACNSNICAENSWSIWSPWGDCSVSCNGGIRTRTRTCDGTDQGEPQGPCSGNNMDITGCNINTCVVPMVYFTMSNPNEQLVSGKATFATSLGNFGDGYNQQTGEFVCPVAGLYHFYLSFPQQSTRYAVYCFIKYNQHFLTQVYTSSDGTIDAASTSVYIQLAVGDVVSVGGCENWQYVLHQSRAGVFTGSLIHL